MVVNDSVEIDQNILEIRVKKFINGEGSLIQLAVNGTAPTIFAAYATYDQGSTKSIEGERKYLLSIPPVWIIVIAYITYFIVGAYVNILLRKRRKRIFVSTIQEQMMEVRNKLKKNILYDEPFPFTLLKEKLPFYKRNIYNATFRWQNKTLVTQIPRSSV